MFAKITIAIALILGTASGALAASKQKHNTKRAYDLYDTHRQYGGSASRAKTVHTKTTHVKRTHAKAAHVKTTHAKATQVQATQVQATQVQATQVKATQVEATHAKAAQVEAARAKGPQSPIRSISSPLLIRYGPRTMSWRACPAARGGAASGGSGPTPPGCVRETGGDEPRLAGAGRPAVGSRRRSRTRRRSDGGGRGEAGPYSCAE